MNKYENRVRELGGRFYLRQEFEPHPLSETDLASVETKIGYPLPADYREFLRDFGGYRFWASFPLRHGPDDYEEGDVGIMFGFRMGSYDLVGFHFDSLLNEVIAPELLQLTRDEMGSVCLFLDGPRKGKIYLWYAEEVRAPYDYANLYFIANSFDEFMNLLEPMPDD